MPRTAAPLVIGLLASALLFCNASFRPNLALDDLRPAGRYWEDLALSASDYLERESPGSGPPLQNGTPDAEDLKHGYRRNLVRGAAELGIAPWQFWRTVPLKPFLDRGRIVQRPYEDAGRSQLMALGYRVLGGVAPYLGLWIAVLLAAGLLVWIAWELCAAGLPGAAAVFTLACGSSCFLTDTLSLAYSAMGFHVVAMLLLSAVSVYAFVGRPGSLLGLLLRFAAAGLLFWVCCLCRTSSLALLPAFLLAAAGGAWRLSGASARRAALPAVLASAVFLAPYGVSRMLAKPSAHDVWATVWEGLGDFDRSKGFVWSDPALREFLRQQGMDVSERDGMEFQGPESESLSRQAVLDAVRDDPGWFLGILAKRLFATLTLTKLWPYAPSDGRSMEPATHPNEGSTDVYWGMSRTADFFALGPLVFELRVGLLLAPLAALLALLGAARLGLVAGQARPAAGQLGLLACLGAGALALPVGITVAAGFEPQSYLLVPLMGLALLVQAMAERLTSMLEDPRESRT